MKMSDQLPISKVKASCPHVMRRSYIRSGCAWRTVANLSTLQTRKCRHLSPGLGGPNVTSIGGKSPPRTKWSI